MNWRLLLSLCTILIAGCRVAQAHAIPTHEPINPEENGPYFQGDMILPLRRHSGRVDLKYRWTNKTVHYEFQEGYPERLQETFIRATKHISDRTCLEFKLRSESDDPSKRDYVQVCSSNGCSSYVGRQGGRQVISLPSPCHNLGTFVHEILHAIGFHHEQSRTDRDDHVTINWENIQPGKEGNFRKYDEATVTSFGVPYDYDSVLHYGGRSFSKDASRLATIVPLVSGARIGQRNGMSERDVEKVNRMYDC